MILLVDGHSLAHRMYHTTYQNDVITGEPCGVPVGFLKFLAHVKTELAAQYAEPVRVAACFDLGRCAWRTDLYPGYKQGRKKPGVKDFMPQVETLYKMLPLIGIHVCRSFGVEADDLIGVLSNALESSTNEAVLIASSDRDLWQLITKYVAVYDLQTGEVVNETRATEILGFPPTRIVEYKALAGDHSDNIPGARGIGEKGAVEILNGVPDLQVLVAQDDLTTVAGLPPALLKKVAASRDDISLAARLCTIAQYPEQLFDDGAREAVQETLAALAGGGCQDPTQTYLVLQSLGLDRDNGIRGAFLE